MFRQGASGCNNAPSPGIAVATAKDRIFILLPCPRIPHWLYCEAGAEGQEGLGEGRKIMLGSLRTNPPDYPS